jgi:hypothetical protein
LTSYYANNSVVSSNSIGGAIISLPASGAYFIIT